MLDQVIQKSLEKLTDVNAPDYRYIPVYKRHLPSVQRVKEMMGIVREIVFPGYFGNSLVQDLNYQTEVNMHKLYHILSEQIYNAKVFDLDEITSDEEKDCEDKTMLFLAALPEIKRLLSTDVKAIFDNDPAAKHYGEIIFCYPAVKAILNHRVAHVLYRMNVPMLPRIITEMAHEETGIDIHPGATIGEYFGIDHGTGIVIGQTAIIGNHVFLYQGVTLGAKSFTLDDAGNPVDIPRHPILEDRVTVYSNSSILGRITIGAGTVVGGNVWLTHSVAPNSRILQFKAQETLFIGGLGI